MTSKIFGRITFSMLAVLCGRHCHTCQVWHLSKRCQKCQTSIELALRTYCFACLWKFRTNLCERKRKCCSVLRRCRFSYITSPRALLLPFAHSFPCSSVVLEKQLNIAPPQSRSRKHQLLRHVCEDPRSPRAHQGCRKNVSFSISFQFRCSNSHYSSVNVRTYKIEGGSS